MKEFDVDLSKFNFKKDLEYGEKGEAQFVSFIEELLDSKVEIKTDRYRNGRMVIETQQNPRNERDELGERVWKPSGINVTTAKWWVYTFGLEGGAFIAIPVQRMKRYFRMNKAIFNESTKIMLAENSDNPAKGFLLYPQHISDMMSSQAYDSPDGLAGG